MSDEDRARTRIEAFLDLAAIFERDTFEGHEMAALIARNAAEMTRIDPADWTNLEFLSQAFGRSVVRLEVPGMSDGRQKIVLTFADSSSITVEADSIEGAWKALREEAGQAPRLSGAGHE